MYTYTMQPMPGCKAEFEGDTSVKYKVSRRYTPAAADQKSRIDVIRTGLEHPDAAALVAKFNDKELEARAAKREGEHRFTMTA